MDWLKIVLDKLFGFVAPVIPGAAVLLLFGLHHPSWAAAIRDITYLGYGTKLALVLAAAFVSGFTVVSAAITLVSFVEGVLGHTLSKWLQGEKPEVPPWRNKGWRALVRTYLGEAAPEDLDLVPENVFEVQIQTANLMTDPTKRFEAIRSATHAKGQAVVVDFEWQSWWNTLHLDVLQPKDPVSQLTFTIEANLQVTSLVLLCAISSTPVLNHWWVISPCLFWLAMRVLRTFAFMRQVRDPWSSFVKQMDYLRSQMPNAKAKAQGGDSQ